MTMGIERFVLCCCLIFIGYANPGASYIVEQVQVLFRHGQRTFVEEELEVLEKANSQLVQPYGIGQLTSVGKNQMFDLGKMLRRQYNDLLGPKYKPGEIYARSSNIDRTKASLQLVLAGLFPPSGKFIWNPELKWMPIPYDAVPKALDNLFFLVLCPEFQDLKDKVLLSEKRAIDAAHMRLFKKMNKVYPDLPLKLSKFFLLNNVLNMQIELDMKLPKWYSEGIHSGITYAAMHHLEILSKTTRLIQLNGGGLAKRMVENMYPYGVPSGVTVPKMFLYSGHEFTIYALAKAHGVTLEKSPEFGSAIIVEKLRGRKGTKFVKLQYWSGASQKLTPIKLKCGEECPLEDYLELVNPYLPSDDDMQCLVNNLKPEKYP